METAIEEAEEREASAEELITQLEKEIDIVRDSSARQASNIEEMLKYGKSGNLILHLSSSYPHLLFFIYSMSSVNF